MKQHHKDVPGSGGHGSRQGNNMWNKNMMKPMPNVERTHKTRDPGIQGKDGYPSMYEMSRAMTSGKWGNSPKTK